MNYSVQEKYEYLLGFPATPANTILVCITIGMSVSFLSNHIIQPNNSLGQFFKYLMEYGRFKTIHNRGFDLPKRYVIFLAQKSPIFHYFFINNFGKNFIKKKQHQVMFIKGTGTAESRLTLLAAFSCSIFFCCGIVVVRVYPLVTGQR